MVRFSNHHSKTKPFKMAALARTVVWVSNGPDHSKTEPKCSTIQKLTPFENQKPSTIQIPSPHLFIDD